MFSIDTVLVIFVFRIDIDAGDIDNMLVVLLFSIDTGVGDIGV